MSPIKRRKHAARVSPPSGSPVPLPLAAALMTGLALAAPFAASAQDARVAAPGNGGPSAEDQVRTLGKVEVVGAKLKRYTADKPDSPKFTQPLVDTTQTVNVIGADLFTEQGATTLTDALRNSAGVGTFFAGENGNTTTGDTVFMRGFDSSSSIFVDGVRDLGSVSRDVFNLEQVEVTKGPAGADNGRTAPTGAINLVSKQPILEDAASASLSYGSAAQRRATADWNQVLGAHAAFRLNLMAQDGGVPGRDTLERKRWGVAPSFAFGLGTATRTTLNLLHIDQDNIPDGGVPTIGLPGYASPDPSRPQIGEAPRVDTSNFYGTLSDHDDVAVDMATLRIEHDFAGGASLRNTTRWGRNGQDYLLTSFMLSADPARFQTPDLDDPSTWLVARSLPTFKDQRNTILANQTNLLLHFGGDGRVQHDLSAGIELTREELRTHGLAALDGTAWPAANLYAPDPDVAGLRWGRNGAGSEGRTDTVAAYAFDTMKVGERWQFNAGARVDRYTTDFSSLVVCGGRNPGCGSLAAGSIVPGVDASDSDTLLGWKAGVLYKPAANGSLYANYAISQQPPGGGSLELSARDNSADNPAFDPQEARTAELGTKWNLFDEGLLLTAAVYDTRVVNEIVQDPLDLQYYQTGEKRVRGVEFTAAGNLTDAWSVSAGYTTMDTEVVEGPAATADGSAALTYTPRNAFTAWTTYRIGKGFTLGGGARYSGGLHRGTDGAVGTPASTESYWVFDAVAGYEFSERVSLRLNLYNLFDEDYVAAINKSGYRYTPGAPRSAMLTASFRF
jgi:catecholate siderophore receptor